MSDEKFRPTIHGSAEYSAKIKIEEMNLEALKKIIQVTPGCDPTVPDYGPHYFYDWDEEKPELRLRADLHHFANSPLDYRSDMMNPFRMVLAEDYPIDFPGSCRHYASMKDCSFSDDIE